MGASHDGNHAQATHDRVRDQEERQRADDHEPDDQDRHGDGRRDLWGSLADVIGSVANYLHRHGWAYGQPVTSRARVADGADMERVSRRNLKPEATVAELGAAGFTPTDDVPEDLPAAVTRLREEDGDSYWLTYQNFYVITRYNHSPLYAMAVHQLGQAIIKKRGELLSANVK